MRIIAGRHRGLALASVGKGDPAAHLRPTSDRVRESLFNVLTNQIDFEGLRVLDLFAGTGALGLESLSRGAAYVTFVENGRTAQRILAENITKTSAKNQSHVLRTDALKLPAGTAHDLVFLDPPYGKGLGDLALAKAWDQGWIAPSALIVWEESAPMQLDGFDRINTRKYGDTHISLLEPINTSDETIPQGIE